MEGKEGEKGRKQGTGRVEGIDGKKVSKQVMGNVEGKVR